MEGQEYQTTHYQYNDGDDKETLYSITGKDDHAFNKLNASRNKVEGYPIGTVFSLVFRLLSELIPTVRNAETPEGYSFAKVIALVEEMIDRKCLCKLTEKKDIHDCLCFSNIDPHRNMFIQFFMQFWNLANSSRYFIELDEIWSYMEYVNNAVESGSHLSLGSFHLFCSNKNLPITGFNRKYQPAKNGHITEFQKETPYFRYNQETDEMIEIPWQTIVRSQLNEEEIIMRASREWEADLWGDPVAEDEPDVVSYVDSVQPKAYYVYDCELNTFQEFFSATIQAIIEQNYSILRCRCCREIFVAHRKDAECCLFTCPKRPEMSCREYENYPEQLRKKRKDICLRAHAKVEANLRSRRTNNDDGEYTKRDNKLGIFIDESYDKRAPIRFIKDYDEKMEMTYNYILWLSKYYSRKYNSNIELFIADLCSIKDGSEEDNATAQAVKRRLLEIHEERKSDL